MSVPDRKPRPVAAPATKVNRVLLPSADPDGVPMFPGPQDLTWIRPPGLPWILVAITPCGREALWPERSR